MRICFNCGFEHDETQMNALGECHECMRSRNMQDYNIDETGLRDNLHCYLNGLANGDDDLDTRMNIEEHLVDVATYANVVNAKAWAYEALPFVPQMWHPKAKSLVRFIEMQALCKSENK